MNSKELAKNMIANIISFGLNIVISFFLSSYIVETLGSDAYGFVKLSNEFVSYASLITIALNSMATRYIMISLNRDKKEASKYYNSVIIANIILSFILLIPIAIIILFCDRFLEIPSDILFDVRLNFIIIFANFIINLLFTTTGQVYYLTNKLYINSIKAMQAKIIHTAIILLLFLSGNIKIFYLALATLISSIYIIFNNIHYRKKLLPDLKFEAKLFEWKKVFTLLKSGIWNSITKLSQIFSSGLDLLVANLFVGVTEMGFLSVAKTIPAVIVNLITSVANVFSPNLTKLYAQDKNDELVAAVKTSMKIMSIFTIIPNAILVTIGFQFYKLWIPSQPAEMIHVLSILTSINSLITGALQPIYSIFTIINKVKENSIIMIIYGFSSILVTLMLLKYTELGVYAIAGVSLIGSIIVSLFYHLPRGAIYIGTSKFTFVPEIVVNILVFILLSIIGRLISTFVLAEITWFRWILTAGIIGIIGLGLSVLIIMNKAEREKFYYKIKNFFKEKV